MAELGDLSDDFVVQGDVVVQDAAGVTRIRLDSETGSIFVHNADGEIVFRWDMPGNNLRFGGHRDGDLGSSMLVPAMTSAIPDRPPST